jgi:metallophosphoesterase (TIGR00282 family)
MSELRIAYLGDIVGSPGRRAVAHAAPILRSEHGADLVFADAENATHGAGLSDSAYRALRENLDGMTLGDHCYDCRQVIPILESDAEPIARPANLAGSAPGKRLVRVESSAPPVYLVTVLGRVMMNLPANDPFATVDEVVGSIEEQGAMVLVEIHAEATSEKIAMAWHCARRWPRRVVGVVGTHTHVQTSDERIVDQVLGAITDLGMTGPHRGVIGRKAEDVLRRMTEQSPTALEVASGDVRAQGVLIRVDAVGRRALGIERIDLGVPG